MARKKVKKGEKIGIKKHQVTKQLRQPDKNKMPYAEIGASL